MHKEVTQYINKQKSPQKEILAKLRRLILKTLPKIEEEMKLGVPWYEGKFYLVGLKKDVNIGFAIKGLTKNEMDLFSGSGKIMRHLKIATAKDIDEKNLVKLLKLVYKKAKCDHESMR
ncbi:DUF1801 domain-containing protein [Patescibacteria group bacterium]|nr:DUF1801 domain-containing protein [Patescibacteria group bacterium]